MNTKDLSEHEMFMVNSLDRYTLEIISLKDISLLFGELEESTMVRTSTFLDQQVY